MLVEKNRLIILVEVKRRTDEHCFRREVGIGSRSQLVSNESASSLDIPSMVTGVKQEKFGRVTSEEM